MADVLGGYQPDTRSESSRRADFDLRRRIKRDGGGGGEKGDPGPPGPPGVVQAVLPGANVTVDATNPAYPIVSSTGGGGTGTNEVWIGTTDPIATNPTIELWFDPDAEGGSGGGGTGADEVWVGPDTPSDPEMELWFDTDAVPAATSATLIVPVPYAEWPPASPQANVLYLRLAP